MVTGMIWNKKNIKQTKGIYEADLPSLISSFSPRFWVFKPCFCARIFSFSEWDWKIRASLWECVWQTSDPAWYSKLCLYSTSELHEFWSSSPLSRPSSDRKSIKTFTVITMMISSKNKYFLEAYFIFWVLHLVFVKQMALLPRLWPQKTQRFLWNSWAKK